MIQCKSEVNEAWLSPAGVFSTVASVASASFCPTSSKRGRHIEAYFPSCQGFHLRKENSHKKPDAFLFSILTQILQNLNFLLQGLLPLSKNHRWSPKRPDSLRNCMLASFIAVYLKTPGKAKRQFKCSAVDRPALVEKCSLKPLCLIPSVFTRVLSRRLGKAGMPPFAVTLFNFTNNHFLNLS